MTDAFSPAVTVQERTMAGTKPTPSTFVPLPYAPGASVMLADQVNPDGSPWEGCARTFLKGAIAELSGLGHGLQASFEPEFSLGRHEGASFTPIDESLCYCATGFHLAHDYTIDLVDALLKQGLEVERHYPELGHGQQEAPVRHAPALRNAATTGSSSDESRNLTGDAKQPAVMQRIFQWCGLTRQPVPECRALARPTFRTFQHMRRAGVRSCRRG